MASVVNTNVMSLNAQRQLGKSQSTQNEAMERLSSGLRINSAKDDAAGLAISTGMQSQIKGINQAVRNANDGVSMAQTAEGSMDEMTNILQRMRELSVQSANDTNSADNRASIQKEVDQLSSELDRIAETTEFNGTKLLNGTAGETTLQIGANSGQTLSFSIDSVTTNDLGLNGNLNKGDLNGGRVTGLITKDKIDVNGVTIGAATAITNNDALSNANAINEKTAETGVTANAYNVVQGSGTDSTTGKEVTGITTGMSIQVGAGDAVTLGATSSMGNLVDTINRDVAGVTASLDDEGGLLLTNDTGEDIIVTGGDAATTGLTAATYKGNVSLTSADGSAISVNDFEKPGQGANTGVAGFLASNGAGSISTGSTTATPGAVVATDKIQINGVDLVASLATTSGAMATEINKLTEQTGVTATANGTGLTFSSADGSAVEITSGAGGEVAQKAALTKLGMGGGMGGKVVDSLGTNVKTAAGATNTIDLIDSALSQISESRAGLGAIQNRLGSTISNLENVSQNLSASNSRIQDADFAAETSKMSKAQILQQAGTSMLSQANASAQSVLSLLG
ncbi:flagellin [Psychromonas sp. SR45-3]|uniref:flagellin N-terminal helical domain-containing protein n=1 Tax=Psychromonas sp. SR45-3 TaxID=2760930 RepID=UPI0015FAC4E5|nr:flagellin [Psychromonas sp. SR45-3]MBB1271643.1 flagellin [Psychromonas sp. SR45-3]